MHQYVLPAKNSSGAVSLRRLVKTKQNHTFIVLAVHRGHVLLLNVGPPAVRQLFA